jgi:DNA repair protein RadC
MRTQIPSAGYRIPHAPLRLSLPYLSGIKAYSSWLETRITRAVMSEFISTIVKTCASEAGQASCSESPRRRLLTRGPGALADAELLALLVGLGRLGDGRAAVATCKSMLQRLGGLHVLWRASPQELLRVEGVGAARACALSALVELSRRGFSGCSDEPLLSDSERAFRFVAPYLLGREQELFFAIGLDARNRPIHLCEVAKGSATAVDVHPREVFAPLIRERAVSAIVAHNHPSGDASPSVADELLTQRLSQAGELLGVPLLDHLIVARGGYRSLAELGRL